MTNEKREELLPCPFCGDTEPVVEFITTTSPLSRTGEWWHIQCSECCATAGDLSETEIEAVNKWNMRATSPKTSGCEFNPSTGVVLGGAIFKTIMRPPRAARVIPFAFLMT